MLDGLSTVGEYIFTRATGWFKSDGQNGHVVIVVRIIHSLSKVNNGFAQPSIFKLHDAERIAKEFV